MESLSNYLNNNLIEPRLNVLDFREEYNEIMLNGGLIYNSSIPTDISLFVEKEDTLIPSKESISLIIESNKSFILINSYENVCQEANLKMIRSNNLNFNSRLTNESKGK